MNANDIGKAVGYAVVNIMKEKGFKSYSLSAKSTLPRETVWTIANGASKNPTIKTIYKFCQAVGMTLSEFFARKEFDGIESEG